MYSILLRTLILTDLLMLFTHTHRDTNTHTEALSLTILNSDLFLLRGYHGCSATTFRLELPHQQKLVEVRKWGKGEEKGMEKPMILKYHDY